MAVRALTSMAVRPRAIVGHCARCHRSMLPAALIRWGPSSIDTDRLRTNKDQPQVHNPTEAVSNGFFCT